MTILRAALKDMPEHIGEIFLATAAGFVAILLIPIFLCVIINILVDPSDLTDPVPSVMDKDYEEKFAEWVKRNRRYSLWLKNQKE